MAATLADSARNRGLCEMMRGEGLLSSAILTPGHPEGADAAQRAVASYAHLDCLSVDVSELATIGARFAGSGETAARVRAAMSASGMYKMRLRIPAENSLTNSCC